MATSGAQGTSASHAHAGHSQAAHAAAADPYAAYYSQAADPYAAYYPQAGFGGHEMSEQEWANYVRGRVNAAAAATDDSHGAAASYDASTYFPAGTNYLSNLSQLQQQQFFYQQAAAAADQGGFLSQYPQFPPGLEQGYPFSGVLQAAGVAAPGAVAGTGAPAADDKAKAGADGKSAAAEPSTADDAAQAYAQQGQLFAAAFSQLGFSPDNQQLVNRLSLLSLGQGGAAAGNGVATGAEAGTATAGDAAGGEPKKPFSYADALTRPAAPRPSFAALAAAPKTAAAPAKKPATGAAAPKAGAAGRGGGAQAGAGGVRKFGAGGTGGAGRGGADGKNSGARSGASSAAAAKPSAPKKPMPAALAKQLSHVNPTQFDSNPAHARYFVIKSYSADDVHKSIKYNVWASTKHGNKRLDQAYKESSDKGPLYLFFSVNGSGCFCGMARMDSPVDYSKSFGAWSLDDKWTGQFNVQWIFIKNIPNKRLRHIRLPNNMNKPVTNSRDTQEIPTIEGKQTLKIFHTFEHNVSILDDFEYFDKAEVTLAKTKTEKKDDKPAAAGAAAGAGPAPAGGAAAKKPAGKAESAKKGADEDEEEEEEEEEEDDDDGAE